MPSRCRYVYGAGMKVRERSSARIRNTAGNQEKVEKLALQWKGNEIEGEVQEGRESARDGGGTIYHGGGEFLEAVLLGTDRTSAHLQCEGSLFQGLASTVRSMTLVFRQHRRLFHTFLPSKRPSYRIHGAGDDAQVLNSSGNMPQLDV